MLISTVYCCWIDLGSNYGFRDVLIGFWSLNFWEIWVSAILIAISLKVARDQDEQIPDLGEVDRDLVEC